jgi:hypothetical protein
MSNLVTFSQANLPSVQSLSTALRSLEKDVAPAGVVIIKMDKTGHWVFGADQTEVEDDATWAVNPFSFVHGFIAWGDGEVLGEKMVPVSQPLPELDAAPPNAKKGWETQVGSVDEVHQRRGQGYGSALHHHVRRWQTRRSDACCCHCRAGREGSG